MKQDHSTSFIYKSTQAKARSKAAAEMIEVTAEDPPPDPGVVVSGLPVDSASVVPVTSTVV